MNTSLSMLWLLGACACLLGALSVFVYALVEDPHGLPRILWDRYIQFMDQKFRSMFLWTPGVVVAVAQVFALFLLIAMALLVDIPFWPLLVLAVLIGPVWYIEHMRKKRLIKLESQIEGLLMAVANSLKSTPSLGDALQSVEGLLSDPMRQELMLAMKEVKLGSTLEQALLLMASRAGSRALDSALSVVLIGRQVGGNLPKVLETTASSFREMSRLEGVVKTKTAEGKMQLWVLVLFPFLLLGSFSVLSPGYFDPLLDSVVGYIVILIAVGLWCGSLLLARKILTVDV